jgi:hypothetical protein
VSTKGKGREREREREREEGGRGRRKDVRLRCVIFNHRLLVFVIHG